MHALSAEMGKFQNVNGFHSFHFKDLDLPEVQKEHVQVTHYAALPRNTKRQSEVILAMVSGHLITQNNALFCLMMLWTFLVAKMLSKISSAFSAARIQPGWAFYKYILYTAQLP